ncbi:MAG: hypothetical protein IJ565_04915 [Bacilli bacterium]|nr:hypothetical protein [Bacilli bacterium]
MKKVKTKLSKEGINIIKNEISNELGITNKERIKPFASKGIPKGITCIGEYNKLN